MTVGAALRAFADAVAAKASLPAAGEAEERLRAPFEALMAAAGAALGHDVACVGEARLPDRMGKPDFAIHRGGLLAGYAELKAPGAGADARRFKGRNRQPVRAFLRRSQHVIRRWQRVGALPWRRARRRRRAARRRYRRRRRPRGIGSRRRRLRAPVARLPAVGARPAAGPAKAGSIWPASPPCSPRSAGCCATM